MGFDWRAVSGSCSVHAACPGHPLCALLARDARICCRHPLVPVPSRLRAGGCRAALPSAPAPCGLPPLAQLLHPELSPSQGEARNKSSGGNLQVQMVTFVGICKCHYSAVRLLLLSWLELSEGKKKALRGKPLFLA